MYGTSVKGKIASRSASKCCRCRCCHPAPCSSIPPAAGWGARRCSVTLRVGGSLASWRLSEEGLGLFRDSWKVSEQGLGLFGPGGCLSAVSSESSASSGPAPLAVPSAHPQPKPLFFFLCRLQDSYFLNLYRFLTCVWPKHSPAFIPAGLCRGELARRRVLVPRLTRRFPFFLKNARTNWEEDKG